MPAMSWRAGLIATCACAVTAFATANSTRAQDNSGADRPTTAPATQSPGATSNGMAPSPASKPSQSVDRNVLARDRARHDVRTTRQAKSNPHAAGQASIRSAGSDAKGAIQ